MFNAKAVISYSSFYNTNDIPAISVDLLRGFYVDDVIMSLIAIRNSIEKYSSQQSFDDILASFGRRLPKEKSKRLYQVIYGEDYFAFTHSIVLSKIIVDVLQTLPRLPASKSAGALDFEEKLLDVILLFNQDHYNSVLLNLEPRHEGVWELMLMQNFSGVDELDYARNANIKHLIFLKFLRLKLGVGYLQLEESFKIATGLGSINEFLSIFLNIYIAVSSNRMGLMPSVAVEDPTHQFLINLELVVDISNGKLNDDLELGSIVSKPFYRGQDEKLYLLDHHDFALIIERVWTYLLYKKSDLPELIGNLPNYGDFQAYLGLEYHERYLMGTLFTTINKAGFRVIPSEGNELADFTIILNEKDVFLIEIKSSALHHRVINNKNLEEFKTFIDKNFVLGKKGVKQLKRNLEYLIKDKNDLLKIRTERRKLTIYPIIIFSEPHLKKNGVNDYINAASRDIFSSITTNFHMIKPITLISADFMIENISLLEKDRSLLKTWICDYHLAVKKRKQKYRQHSSMENYMEAMVEFDAWSIGKNGAQRVSQLAIFQDLGRRFKLRESMD